MTEPYWSDGQVSLYLGDMREVLMLKLSRFRVGGHDDEDGNATQPVRVICTECKRPSPWFTYREDGGADYTAPLDDLAKWADAHRCLRNVGE